MPGALDPNDRLPERSSSIGVSKAEAELPWYDQLWWQDFVGIAVPVALVLVMLFAMVWAWRSRRS